ncbi:hypothetical protein BXZ70DRAFT_919382 [Cristinia sonorae]|uniref:DNA replication regulator Sld3 C-terminal domain-containing protein n=1 Tax=Cristinia sonorae TaxID=1940300 RepID=A0A8K0UVS8_9AGAR|nr:hypothetical protein BXZ70DRAFT_919382 [Cristinia sonorae]
MADVSRLPFVFQSGCPVKWTSTQERSLGREYPFDTSADNPESYVLKTYLQALYLPESISPLNLLVPLLTRVTPTSGLLSRKGDHPLHKLLMPILLTPRSSAHKYQTRIPQLLSDEEVVPNPEASMLWYAYKFEKTGLEDLDEQTQEAAEEKWRSSWLGRLERRDVMIHILLYFLLLSLSDPDDFGAPDLLLSPKNRKTAAADLTLSYNVLEERLEGFMDKLSMWQLTDSLETLDSGVDQSQQILPNSRRTGKGRDERDGIQIFCEDVVEPIFKETLPSHCTLLRSKVFPHSPFSDDSDTLSPPSPKEQNKRIKASGSSSRRTSPRPQSKPQARQLERSRSLSVTLEEERERSRSLSVGPANMRRRVLTREVSMTTAFKPKPSTSTDQPAVGKRKAILATAQPQGKPRKNTSLSGGERDKGRTLVESTPAKPKGKAASLFRKSSSSKDVIPALSFPEKPRAETDPKMTVEGDGDDDEWMVSTSPDVLLLTSSSAQEGWDTDSQDDDGMVEASDRDDSLGGSQILVSETPTKVVRSR